SSPSSASTTSLERTSRSLSNHRWVSRSTMGNATRAMTATRSARASGSFIENRIRMVYFNQAVKESRDMYRYGLIGNCEASALVSDTGAVEWFCLPRPDSPPVFGALLDPEGGDFAILPPEGALDIDTEQYYTENTN